MGKLLSDNELISAINHSSDPFVIVEGKEDVMIYRWLLNDIGCEPYLEPRNGCSAVRTLYDRRGEFTNPKVIFICDRDINVYTGALPEGYEEIIYTEGYSIENDLYKGRQLEEKLFDKKDKELFEKALDSFLNYYACELEKFINGEEFCLRKKPEAIINNKDYSLQTELLSNYRTPSHDTIEYLRGDYDLLIRGHSLFKLVGMILHRKGRAIPYHEMAISEMCYKLCKSDCIERLQEKIKEAIL